MSDHWDEITNGMRQAGEGLQQAIQGWIAAGEAIRQQREEHGDLRDHVENLERLVIEQTRELRALRDRLNGGTPHV